MREQCVITKKWVYYRHLSRNEAPAWPVENRSIAQLMIDPVFAPIEITHSCSNGAFHNSPGWNPIGVRLRAKSIK